MYVVVVVVVAVGEEVVAREPNLSSKGGGKRRGEKQGRKKVDKRKRRNQGCGGKGKRRRRIFCHSLTHSLTQAVEGARISQHLIVRREGGRSTSSSPSSLSHVLPGRRTTRRSCSFFASTHVTCSTTRVRKKGLRNAEGKKEKARALFIFSYYLFVCFLKQIIMCRFHLLTFFSYLGYCVCSAGGG